jgi:hypothetical protein
MIDLRHHFGRAYVINLDSRPDRWVEFQERAAAAGITGFERVRAIEGDKCPHPAWWRAGNGAWGCLMSHLRIAQDALLDDLPSYVVFEDDAVFSEDFADRLPLTMLRLDGVEWDMLYLGGQHLWVESGPPWPFCKGIVRCRNVNRTHAFAVSARFLAQFQQHIIHAPDYIDSPEPLHIDHQLGRLHEWRQHRILAIDPWLCGQGGGKSNISGEENQTQWWLDKGWG